MISLGDLIRKIIRKQKDGTLIDAIKIKVHRKFYFNINYDYKNTIFLASSGRSGSTWVSNIINYKNKYRYMFEPFHSKYVDICRNFNYRQYLRPDNSKKEYLEPAEIILTGRIRDKWIDRFNRKLICRNRLIKDIRANLLLKWLKSNFPEMKIVFLLRHPMAVVNSRQKLGWGPTLKFFLSQEDLKEDYLEPFIRDIKNAQSGFEEQIFSWCVENYVPLKQFNRNDIHVSFYEDFCINAEKTIGTLFDFLGVAFNRKIMENLHIPSPEVRDESAILTGENLIEKWKKNFGPKQIKTAIEILSLFGLDEIYSEDTIPASENVFKILRKKK